jgi:predicted lipoprotein with Yx(FWY)xxD motif
MSRSRPITFLALATAVPLAALAVAGCGGGNDANSAAITPAKTASGRTATIALANEGKLGNVVVDKSGDTLYLFEKDAAGKSACSGACATNWPPLRATGKPLAGQGADAAAIGTIKRSDGTSQVTYNGHPLYRYTGDARAGDAAGQGLNAFGGEWYVVGKSGNAVDTEQNDSGGGGNGY